MCAPPDRLRSDGVLLCNVVLHSIDILEVEVSFTAGFSPMIQNAREHKKRFQRFLYPVRKAQYFEPISSLSPKEEQNR